MSRCGCGGKPLLAAIWSSFQTRIAAPAHARRVVIVGEGEMVAGVEPAVVGVAEAVEFADVDHSELAPLQV